MILQFQNLINNLTTGWEKTKHNDFTVTNTLNDLGLLYLQWIEGLENSILITGVIKAWHILRNSEAVTDSLVNNSRFLLKDKQTEDILHPKCSSWLIKC